jgi:2-oxoisovalerate dehydrogenase E1 component alpha subunit
MTYRGSHHSTSDDYTRYRSQAEVDSYLGTNSPIRRLKAHLLKRKLWTEEQDKELFTKAKRDVLTAVKKAEQELKPPLDDLFNDVYDKDTWMIAEQRKELADHMAKYPEYYSTKDYKQ